MANGPHNKFNLHESRFLMNTRRLFSASMVLAASLVATLPVLAATSPFSRDAHTPKIKQVSLNFRNDTASTIKVKAGDTELTLAPGKTVHAKIAAGEKIVNEDATPTVAAGSVLAVVAPQMSDATVVIR
jgi:hypothetical protein